MARPVVKIALAAPFEGRYRDVGYEVVYAVRLAVREANARGGVAGYSVELLALDDSGEPDMAVAQARKVAADPQVVGVMGHWLAETTLAAAREYEARGIPMLATAADSSLPASTFRIWPAEADGAPCHPVTASPCPPSLESLDWLADYRRQNPEARLVGPALWGQAQFAALAGPAAEGMYFAAPAPLPADCADPAFADRYRAISGGVEPRFSAVLAYDAAWLLFDAIRRDAEAHGAPSRAGVAEALAQSDYAGLSGRFAFDENRSWVEARGWLYQWRGGQITRPQHPSP